MKQHINIVKEFNSWRRGTDDVHVDDKAYPKRLGEALDEVVKAAERYEFIRTLAPVEFTRLWQNNIHDRGRFDDLVDEMMKYRK